MHGGQLVKNRKRIKVHVRKLGREGALGLSYGDGNIEVDPRQDSREFMDTLIHECLHELFPEASEEKVTAAGTTIAAVLWKMRYRRIER